VVNAVSGGVVDTGLKHFPNRAEMLAEWKKEHLGRMVQIEDMVNRDHVLYFRSSA
jgi:hypothetical protein